MTWTKVSNHGLLDCRVFKVRALMLRSERTGREHDFYVLDCADWVNVIATTDLDELVLVRQHRAGIDRASLEVPGGMVDPGEAPLEAARRELLEETGYAPREIVPIGTIHPNPALQGNVTHSFLATGCRRVAEPKLDSTEEIEVVLEPASRTDELLRSGEISHALVAVAFLHWKLRGSTSTR